MPVSVPLKKAENPPKRAPGRPKAIAAPPKTAKEPPGEKLPPPKVNIPSFADWHDYIGNFALKWITRGYIAFVFRGIDRWELLSPQDNDALELDDQALSDIAKPLAHIAARSGIGRKHGRMIIDSSDAVAASITFVMWANRVGKIAKKYRPEKGTKHEHGSTIRGKVESSSYVGSPESGPDVQEPAPAYSGNGQRPNGFGYN